MPKPAPLAPGQAQRTLAHRLAARVDRLRQFNTKFGIRSYRVFLVWSRWTGARRGEGREFELVRVEILPTPRVNDISGQVYRGWSAGVLPEGTLRITEISVHAFTSDNLTGRRIPAQYLEQAAVDHGAPLRLRGSELVDDPRVDFWWEVLEDGRGDDPSARQRYRRLGAPHRRETRFTWEVLLERASQESARTGGSQEQDEDVVVVK